MNRRSICERTSRSAHPNEILSVWFARGMAIKYLLYTVWAAINVWETAPRANEDLWQVLFSGAILIATSIAMFGAIFFPRTGRLEMFAGAGFIGLVCAYILLSMFDGLDTDVIVLLSSLLVMPVTRTAYIYRTLVRTSQRG